jgi:ABC-type bacteriocin/lantibiotic exporter with double-glycine peptidase domain
MDHGVPHIAQSQEMSCWAASAAMMLSWQYQASYTEQSVLDHFPEFGSDGADVAECLKLSQELGMRQLAEACRTPQGWEQELQSSPIMVGIPGHFIVVDGIQQNGDAWEMHVLDPAGGANWLSYEYVEEQYELDHMYGNDLMRW